ncbi:hypothetical protein HY772_04780, partial [Candidatus Woesearchaeota archaeon]|nr:hypothetical protein [Candidatus Woesearchaeota archaeon]
MKPKFVGQWAPSAKEVKPESEASFFSLLGALPSALRSNLEATPEFKSLMTSSPFNKEAPSSDNEPYNRQQPLFPAGPSQQLPINSNNIGTQVPSLFRGIMSLLGAGSSILMPRPAYASEVFAHDKITQVAGSELVARAGPRFVAAGVRPTPGRGNRQEGKNIAGSASVVIAEGESETIGDKVVTGVVGNSNTQGSRSASEKDARQEGSRSATQGTGSAKGVAGSGNGTSGSSSAAVNGKRVAIPELEDIRRYALSYNINSSNPQVRQPDSTGPPAVKELGGLFVSKNPSLKSVPRTPYPVLIINSLTQPQALILTVAGGLGLAVKVVYGGDARAAYLRSGLTPLAAPITTISRNLNSVSINLTQPLTGPSVAGIPVAAIVLNGGDVPLMDTFLPIGQAGYYYNQANLTQPLTGPSVAGIPVAAIVLNGGDVRAAYLRSGLTPLAAPIRTNKDGGVKWLLIIRNWNLTTLSSSRKIVLSLPQQERTAPAISESSLSMILPATSIPETAAQILGKSFLVLAVTALSPALSPQGIGIFPSTGLTEPAPRRNSGLGASSSIPAESYNLASDLLWATKILAIFIFLPVVSFALLVILQKVTGEDKRQDSMTLRDMEQKDYLAATLFLLYIVVGGLGLSHAVGFEFPVIIGMSFYYLVKLLRDIKKNDKAFKDSVYSKPTILSAVLTLVTFYVSNGFHHALKASQYMAFVLINNHLNDFLAVPLFVLLTPVAIVAVESLMNNRRAAPDVANEIKFVLGSATRLIKIVLFWALFLSVIEVVKAHSDIWDIVAYFAGGLSFVPVLYTKYPDTKKNRFSANRYKTGSRRHSSSSILTEEIAAEIKDIIKITEGLIVVLSKAKGFTPEEVKAAYLLSSRINSKGSDIICGIKRLEKEKAISPDEKIILVNKLTAIGLFAWQVYQYDYATLINLAESKDTARLIENSVIKPLKKLVIRIASSSLNEGRREFLKFAVTGIAALFAEGCAVSN